ncbi:hypothetical protein [Klebsiella spallanzanii]|uniref:hypothetical protein n=1 Tax=Klebsiella spallanzanii TaxID=2587528 RepID=UPI00259A8625|nr:hypothetical protein [Klebsiella spallanzanii]MDM4206402.1 hypothetical protein [Klebsiella spallanzanii]
MLRDFLMVEKEDCLVEQRMASSEKANPADVTEWIIVNKNGDKKGRVALFNQFTTRRSYCVNYRITQFDNSGNVVVDRLAESL